MEIFAWISPTKLNYESIVDKGWGVQISVHPKRLPRKHQKQPQDLFFESGAQKIFYKSYQSS